MNGIVEGKEFGGVSVEATLKRETPILGSRILFSEQKFQDAENDPKGTR